MTNWFQSDECLKFYESLDFVEAFECRVERDGELKGRMVGYIQKDGSWPKNYLSRRAIINGGPMLADDISERELGQLLSDCKKTLQGKAIYVETRNFSDYSRYKDVFAKCGWQYEPHYDFRVTVSPEVVSSMSTNHKRNVKSGLRNGAEIVVSPSSYDVDAFYDVLSHLYSQKVKTPLFPKAFFEKLADVGELIVIKAEGQVIGGIAMAVLPGETCYEWFICGEDVKYKTYHPSTIATYAGIKYAADNGYKYFDFMGAGSPGDGGYGVRDFKAKFGGELVEYGRFKCVLNPVLYKIGTLGVKLIKKFR